MGLVERPGLGGERGGGGEQEAGGGVQEAGGALKLPSMAPPYSSASGATRPWPEWAPAMAAGGARNT